jgi:dihydrolipoamide dehydrogenase
MDGIDGFIKVIAAADFDRVLGVHIFGPQASHLIAEAVLALEMCASAEDLARTMHAHPTLSEVLREAAAHVG